MRSAILLALLVLLAAGALAREQRAEGAGEAVRDVAERQTVVVPPASDEAMSYYRSGNVLWVISLLWGLAVPAAILVTGFSVRLRDLASRLTGGRWALSVVLFFALYSIVTFAADLPLAFYQGFVRQHAYGLSNQTLAKWAADSFKALGVGIVGGGLVIWMPYLLLQRSPRRWWLYCGVATVPFLLLVMLVSPIWIAPLFNDFGPMRDKALESRILELADRTGVDADRVYEVAKSVDTKRVNAYVTGFLGTKRIVLWDTTVERLEPEGVLYVMGHELGHYVLGHVVSSVVFMSALTLLGLYLIYRVSGAVLGRWGGRFGFRTLSDAASLPLLVLLFDLYVIAVSPVGLAFSRHHEREADRFGLELVQDNRVAAQAFVDLQTENLSNPYPGPIFRFFRASHPPIGERVAFCNAYRPWEAGDPLVYGELIEPATSDP